MPKSSSARTKRDQTPHEQFLVFIYEGRRLALPKKLLEEKDHKDTILLVRKAFSIPPARKEITLHTSNLPDFQDDEEVEIPDMTWEYALPSISRVKVIAKEEEHVCRSLSPALDPAEERVDRLPPAAGQADMRTIRVWRGTATKKITINWDRSLLTSILKAFAPGLDPDEWKIIYDDRRIDSTWTPRYLDMEEGDGVELFKEQKGDKPVIYLFPPKSSEEMDVAVDLALVPQWKFFAIYPVVPTKSQAPSGHGENLTWSVHINEDQTLTEKTTGLTVSYLYWEAETQAVLPTPPGSPVPGDEMVQHFDPITSDVSDDDGVSVLLPLAELTPYLDAALKSLGLHTEARTSFITYWLPSFNKHTYIALRFVPQAAYARAASLNIVPQPDVLTRVFMLFQGVEEPDLWLNAIARVPESLEKWKDVIGCGPADVLADDDLFRVLEWGGMEVKKWHTIQDTHTD